MAQIVPSDILAGEIDIKYLDVAGGTGEFDYEVRTTIVFIER